MIMRGFEWVHGACIGLAVIVIALNEWARRKPDAAWVGIVFGRLALMALCGAAYMALRGLLRPRDFVPRQREESDP
jgi:hypothetical protein